MAEGTIKRLTDKGFGFIDTGDGKGVFFHALRPPDLEHTELVSLTMDCDARVRVYKA